MTTLAVVLCFFLAVANAGTKKGHLSNMGSKKKDLARDVDSFVMSRANEQRERGGSSTAGKNGSDSASTPSATSDMAFHTIPRSEFEASGRGCRHFDKDGACAHGRTCNFLHVLKDGTIQPTACRFYNPTHRVEVVRSSAPSKSSVTGKCPTMRVTRPQPTQRPSVWGNPRPIPEMPQQTTPASADESGVSTMPQAEPQQKAESPYQLPPPGAMTAKAPPILSKDHPVSFGGHPGKMKYSWRYDPNEEYNFMFIDFDDKTDRTVTRREWEAGDVLDEEPTEDPMTPAIKAVESSATIAEPEEELTPQDTKLEELTEKFADCWHSCIPSNLSSWQIGDRVDAQWLGEWYPAKVIQDNGDEGIVFAWEEEDKSSVLVDNCWVVDGEKYEAATRELAPLPWHWQEIAVEDGIHSGSVYYWNPRTGVTQWTRPREQSA